MRVKRKLEQDPPAIDVLWRFWGVALLTPLVMAFVIVGLFSLDSVHAFIHQGTGTLRHSFSMAHVFLLAFLPSYGVLFFIPLPFFKKVMQLCLFTLLLLVYIPLYFPYFLIIRCWVLGVCT